MMAVAGLALVLVSLAAVHVVDRTPKARMEAEARQLRPYPWRPNNREEDEHWIVFGVIMAVTLAAAGVLYPVAAGLDEDTGFAVIVLGMFAVWAVAGPAVWAVRRVVNRRAARRDFARPPTGPAWPGPLLTPMVHREARAVALVCWAVDVCWPGVFFHHPQPRPRGLTDRGAADAVARVRVLATVDVDAILNRLEVAHGLLPARRRWSHQARRVPAQLNRRSTPS